MSLPNTKDTKLQSYQEKVLAKAHNLSPKQYIFIAFIIALIGLLIVLMISLSHRPKPIEEYIAITPEALKMDSYASDVSKTYQPLRDQLGDADYDKYVLKLDGEAPSTIPKKNTTITINQDGKRVIVEQKKTKSTAEIAQMYIDEVNENTDYVRQNGGIADLEQLRSMYDGQPKDPEIAKRINDNIDDVIGAERQDLSAEIYVDN